MRMSSLKGKKALVLGGSRGIGAAIVERLAAEGAETVFTYAGSKDAAAALAGRTGTRAVQADSADRAAVAKTRSEEHTSELQSLMRISYAVFCLKKKNKSTA